MKTVFTFFEGWRTFALAFALVLPGSLALGQSTINYVPLSTPNPDPNFPWDFQGMRLSGGRSYNLDFNNDGTPEYIIRASGNNSPHSFSIYAQGENSIWVLPTFDSSLAGAWSAGTVVGPDLSSSTYRWEQNAGGGAVFSASLDVFVMGQYAFVDSAYCPLRFVLGGQTHYGWVRVGAPLPGFNFGWIYDYAYETRPGTAISTGAKPVVIPLAPPGIVRPGYLRLRWLSDVDVAYQVQAKVQLDEPVWTNLEFTILATSTNTIADIPVVGARRFFRIVEAD